MEQQITDSPSDDDMRNLSKILDNLYLGDYENSTDRELLDRLGIRDILSVFDHPRREFADMNYLLIDIEDSPLSHLDDYFAKCNNFIHQCRLANRPVLVHCAVGISRSVTIVVAYLLTITKLSWQICLEAVQEARPEAYPNCGFIRQLADYQELLARQLATTPSDSEATLALQQYWNYPFRDDDVRAIEMLVSGQ